MVHIKKILKKKKEELLPLLIKVYTAWLLSPPWPQSLPLLTALGSVRPLPPPCQARCVLSFPPAVPHLGMLLV